MDPAWCELQRAYKTALALSSAGVGVCLIGSSLASGLVAAAAILLLTGVMDGLNSPANPSVTQTFAGPWATGRWMGIQNAVGNVAGMTAPVVTGYLVQHTGPTLRHSSCPVSWHCVDSWHGWSSSRKSVRSTGRQKSPGTPPLIIAQHAPNL